MTQFIFVGTEAGWENVLCLTLAGRNDWVPQLLGPSQTFFFYSSVRPSGVISEMIKLPRWIGYLRVRGSSSPIGMPYPRLLTVPTCKYGTTVLGWLPKAYHPIGKLYPKRTDSRGAGLDATFLENLRLSTLFYYASTYN